MGGFFVLYDLMKRSFKISIGKASLICNSLIIIFGVFIFGLDKCIYALIAIYISTYVGDRVMLGVSRNKAFYIITNKPYLIKDYIINNLNHTVTIVAAKGGYSDKRKKVLLLYMTLILVLRRVNLFLLLELVVVVSLHLLRCYIERKNLIRVLL